MSDYLDLFIRGLLPDSCRELYERFPKQYLDWKGTSMRTIWKETLKITNRQTIMLPKEAILFSVGNKHGMLCLWFFVEDSNQPEEPREIEIIGTGNPIPEGSRRFIGTVIMDQFTWHVFENLDNDRAGQFREAIGKGF